MALLDVFNEIEGVNFAATLDVFSGFASMRRYMVTDPRVKTLLMYATSSPDYADAILNRAKRMLAQDKDSDYRHRHDEALVAYVYVLGQSSEAAFFDLLEEMKSVSNIWLSRKMANYVYEQMQTAKIRESQQE